MEPAPDTLKLEVIPAILEKEWSEIEKKIKRVKSFATTIHIDLLDGKFVENETFLDPKPFAKYAKDYLLELHMMVDEPIQYLKPFADAGFKRFLGHIEKMSDQVEFIAQGQLLGEVGLAIDGTTRLENVKVSLEDLDAILVMTINAGFSKQRFQPELLEKVAKIREKSPSLPIEVDGGINADTAKTARDKGATRFSTNSYLFSSKNPHNMFTTIQKKLQ